MKPVDEPPRLLDSPTEAPGELRRALREARAELPSELDIQRLASRMGPLLQPPPGVPPAAPPVAPPVAAVTSSPVLTTIVLPALFGGAVMASLMGLHEWSQPPKPHASVAVVPSAARVVSAAPVASALVASVPVRSTPVAPVTAPTDSPPVAPVPSVAVARPVAMLLKNEPDAPTEPAPEVPEPTVAPAPIGLPGATPETAPGGAAPLPIEAPAESEASLLKRLVAALTTSPAQALTLVAEHERRFPAGALVQEREFVAIQALLRLGRGGEARARADRFRVSFPQSAHLRRLDALFPDANGP